MNARKAKKYLKKRISELESDNKLMHRIIADSAEMQRLYEQYNKPLNDITSTLQFDKFQVKRRLPFPYDKMDVRIKEFIKQEVAIELIRTLNDYVIYEQQIEYGTPVITASIFVGKNEDNKGF